MLNDARNIIIPTNVNYCLNFLKNLFKFLFVTFFLNSNKITFNLIFIRKIFVII